MKKILSKIKTDTILHIIVKKEDFDSLGKNNEEIIALNKELVELQKQLPKTNVEEVKQEIVKEQEKSDKQAEAKIDKSAKRQSYFGTSVVSSTKTGVVKNIFTTTLENTLQKLKDLSLDLEINKKGKK